MGRLDRRRHEGRHRTGHGGGRAGACIALLACVSGACAGQRTDSVPVAALSSSPEAAAAFSAIRDAWADPNHVSLAERRAALEHFLARYPRDGRAPFVRVALALVAMTEGDYATADAQLTLTLDSPPGSTHDLWTIASARRLRLHDSPGGALALLRPLVGKNVDPTVRAVFEDELALSALAMHSASEDYEAITYMDAWLRSSSEDEKTFVLSRVTELVERLPRDVLVGALQAMRAQRATYGYGVDIERVLAARLVHIATTSDDAELARILLDTEPNAISTAGDAGAHLGELATSRRGLNVVQGRTVGLLLPTESPALRDESADVLRGVMWALGMPRGVRSSSHPLVDVDAGAPLEPCAALEPAPDLDEPQADEGLRLITRDDAGSADRTEVSLDELAGDGAAVIVAGLDGQTAARAMRWGDDHGVPVIVLVPPDATGPGDGGVPRAGPVGGFAFVLGESRANVVAALAGSAPALVGARVAPIVDASEVASYPPGGGTLFGLHFGPPVSCDVPAAHAGEPRFPLGTWDTEKTRAWLVSGSPECATDLVGELSAARVRGIVARTLEAAGRPVPAGALHDMTARAGVVPEAGPTDPRRDEVRRFAGALGRTGWWSALGRDAAVLARTALLKLPLDTVSELAAVAARRTAGRDDLASAHARLWSTETAGWSADHTMKRTICTMPGM
jgi:hypothetical protein